MAEFDKKLLDYDPVTNTKRIFYGSKDGESYTIETIQDAEPIIDLAHYQNNHEVFNKKSDFWHAASIPMTLVYKWKREGVDIFSEDPWDQKKIRDKLNNGEMNKFRVRQFRL